MSAEELGRPNESDVRGMAVHVDHEMSRLLRIGETLRCWRLLLPETCRRALRVAYAAHARALLQFFHEGRPGEKTWGPNRPKTKDGDFDIWLGDYTSEFRQYPWGDANRHRERLRDADKLVGHLSTRRLQLGGLPEWGDAEDRAWVRKVIETIMTAVPDAAHRFPDTHRALKETRT